MRGRDCDRASYRGCSKTYLFQAGAAACRFFLTANPIIEPDAVTTAQPIPQGGGSSLTPMSTVTTKLSVFLLANDLVAAWSAHDRCSVAIFCKQVPPAFQ